MKYNRLGNTGITVSEIGFGVLTMGGSQLNLTVEEGASLLKYALSRGFSFIDTAQYYECYEYIYEAIKDSDYRPVICSKCLGRTYIEMEAAVNEALTELHLDKIDIFLLHEVRNGSDFDDRRGAWECLKDFKARGIIDAIGISTHHVDVTERAADIEELDVIFPLINYASLGIRKGDGFGTCEEMEEAILKASKKGKGVFLMKAFGGGNITGTYQKALDYSRSVKGADSVMIGFGSTDEIDQMLSYLDGTMDKDFQPDVSKKIIRIDQGDCEGCGACKERCPNHAIYWNENGLADVNRNLCLTCGYCAPVCPVRAIILL